MQDENNDDDEFFGSDNEETKVKLAEKPNKNMTLPPLMAETVPTTDFKKLMVLTLD